MKVSASIFAGDFLNIDKLIPRIENTDYIHLDVMDGHFVPNHTFGNEYLKLLSSKTNIPIDAHLMIDNPDTAVDRYIEHKPYVITFHIEAAKYPLNIIKRIKEAGIKAGISLNPATPVESIKWIAEYIDWILVMTVEPGFYGQKFIEACFKKIEDIVGLKSINPDLKVEVDGGVNEKNLTILKSLGVDIVVVGSFLFSSKDYASTIEYIKNI